MSKIDNDLPDDWNEDHDGQSICLNSTKVAAEIARLQEAVSLYSEGSIRLTAENEKLKKELGDAQGLADDLAETL